MNNNMIANKSKNKNVCKICNGEISIYEHTAKCNICNVLLYYPYVTDDELLSNVLTGDKSDDFWNNWYSEACFFNHTNFTNMFRFVFDRSMTKKCLNILDFGGGRRTICVNSQVPPNKLQRIY